MASRRITKLFTNEGIEIPPEGLMSVNKVILGYLTWEDMDILNEAEIDGEGSIPAKAALAGPKETSKRDSILELEAPPDDVGRMLASYQPDREKFQKLMDWMDAGGAETWRLKLPFYNDEFHGAVTGYNIAAEERILFVPYS